MELELDLENGQQQIEPAQPRSLQSRGLHPGNLTHPWSLADLTLDSEYRRKRMAWKQHIIDVARASGDQRSAKEILEENLNRSRVIRRVFVEAHRDRDIAETIVKPGHHYPAVGIHEGEVLHQGRTYMHPRLRPI